MSNLERRSIWPPTFYDGKGRGETTENPPRHCPCCSQEQLNTTGTDGEECIPLYPIGAGGFCDVFVARYRGARVAMKTPRQRQGRNPVAEGDSYDENVYRLMLEGSILQRLNHPNIIRVYKYQCNPPHLVMELHEEGSLQSLMRRHSETLMDKKTLLTWARQIASAMKYWHGLGVLLCHGDLTTANILISAAGDAIVCDAGMAKYREDADEFMAGIPDPGNRNYLYQPPEAILNGTFGEKSDVYSFGFILLEMVTGEEPFEIVHPGCIHGMHRQIARERMQPTIPDNLSEMPGWCPALQDCVNLVKRCWSVYLNERPSFAEIEEELTHILEALDRPVAKKSATTNTVMFVLATIAAVVLEPCFCTCLWTHESPRSINSSSVSGNGRIPESGELLEFSYFVTVMALASMMVPFVLLFLSATGNKNHCRSFSEKLREDRMRIGAWLSEFLQLPWWRSADRDAIPDTPFRRRLPHVLRSDSLECSHHALTEIPLPDAQEWIALCQRMLHDVTHHSTEMPWGEEIHSFCESHEESCPNAAQWKMLLEMLADSPVARAMPSWAEFEARFIEPSAQHAQLFRDPGEPASEPVSLPVSFNPATSEELQLWGNDPFRHVQAGNEVESTAGLSSVSTLPCNNIID